MRNYFGTRSSSRTRPHTEIQERSQKRRTFQREIAEPILRQLPAIRSSTEVGKLLGISAQAVIYGQNSALAKIATEMRNFVKCREFQAYLKRGYEI